MDTAKLMESTELLIAIAISVPTIGGYLLTAWARFGKVGVIIRTTWKAVRTGNMVDDKEMATVAWQIMSVLTGFWPGANANVLKFAPDHQLELLKAEGFIK